MHRPSPQRLIRKWRSGLRCDGFTLVELLIVCGLLAAIAAMSWPAVRGSLAKSRLKKAASDLRTTIGRTRNDAIRKGQSFSLRYELNGSRYRIERFSGQTPDVSDGTGDLPVSLNDGSTVGLEPSSNEEGDFEPIEKELPEGVRFTSVDVESTDASIESFPSAEALAPAEEILGPEVAESTEWSEPIVFHANGRTDNAQLRVINQRDFFIDLSLRGLTGIVTSTPPARIVTTDEGDSLLSDGADVSPLPMEADEP
ncbi:MAG: prepilin-type N-terminal cleavage/methylation domain-containing protein [Planctomycetaceae bacterium]|nr:prepilin-type N-terminal cleavage/methylation domain-containing protein [Planctomycetaceae bacterium]